MQDFSLDCLGAKIKSLRKNKALTQDEFSEILGIDPKHLSRIECGKTQPSLSLMKKMSIVLDIELYHFFKTDYIETKENLIKKINDILSKSNKEMVEMFYRIIDSISN